MASTNGWLSPIRWTSGSNLTAQDLRAVLADLEDKFDRQIGGTDLDSSSGTFQIDGDLDLLGHSLLNANNVPTGIVSVKAYGVQGNGTADDTSALNNALAAISSAGYRVAFIPAGSYLVTNTVTIPLGMTVFGAGSGSKILMSSALSVPALRGANAVTIRDLSFDEKTSTSASLATAIEVGGANDVTIENIRVRKFGTALAISGAAGTTSNVFVEDFIADYCSYGILINNALNVALSGAYINNTTNDAVTITGSSSQFKLSGIGIYAASGRGIVVTAGSAGTITAGIYSSYGHGIELKGCRSVSLRACHVNMAGTDAASSGIVFDGCTGCSVSSSHSWAESGASMKYAMSILGGRDNIVSGNILGPVYRGGPTSYAKEDCYFNDGENTLEFGNFPVRL